MSKLDNMSPQSGRIIGEDGKVYNMVDLLKNAGGGGMDPEDYYTKQESDAKYQPKGNYATTAQLNNKADQVDLNDLIARVEALEGGA
ncbi:hypothetical protein KK120_08735 [Virgibacillus dakarensis]|nr:hypothetical protein [Virgibacillus dakarensis]MBT2215907.1 hypothetical protein [Virgibacillus dakarensis]